MKRAPLAVGLLVLGLGLLVMRGSLGGGMDEEIPFVSIASTLHGRLDLDAGELAQVRERVQDWQQAVRRGRDGRQWPVFGPAQSLVAVPLYLLGRLAGGGQRDAAVRWSVMLNPLVTALTAALLCAWLLLLGCGEGVAVAGALGFALCTPAWPYAKTFLSEPLSAFGFLAGAFGAWLAARRERADLAWAAGLALALAVLTRPHNVVLVPLLLGPLWWGDRRRLAAAAVLPGLTALWWMGFNLRRFGAPLDFGYLPEVQGNFSPASLPLGVVGQLCSPGRGLLWYAPGVLLACWGYGRLAARDRGLARVLVAAGLVQLLFYSLRTIWWGNWCWGPRYLVPVLPLLAVLAACGLETAPRALAWTLGLLGLAGALAGLVVYNGLYQDYMLKQFGGFTQLLWQPRYSPLVGHWRLLLTGRAPLDLLLAQVLRQDAAFGLALALPRLVLVGLGVKLLATGAGDAAR